MRRAMKEWLGGDFPLAPEVNQLAIESVARTIPTGFEPLRRMGGAPWPIMERRSTTTEDARRAGDSTRRRIP